MGWFDDLKKKAADEYAKYNDAPFADAITAICALTAAADDELEKEERAAFATMLTKSAMLARFDRAKMAKRFDELANKALDVITREDVFAVLDKIAADKSKLTAAVNMGVVTAKSDGEFEPAEGRVLLEICNRYGLDADAISKDIKVAAAKAAA